MKEIKRIFIVSSLLILITCSKDDGYGPTDSYSGSSNSYNSPSSGYGSSSTSTTSVTQYSLTVSAGAGGSVSTSGGTYDDGASISITATPNDGYEFTGWNGSDSTSSTITITINSNITIQALFNQVQITETTSTDTSIFNADLIDFNYYLHSSLPDEWITEFNTIMNNLESTIPTFKRSGFPESMNIYAWNNSVSSPYTDPNGNSMQGASISGNGTDFWMVLEIPDDEFTNNSSHRYSVIAHEYFHVYQHSMSPAFSVGSDGEFNNPNAMDVKWLIEGSAAAFESLYIQENYGINYFEEGQAWGVEADVLSNPASYEYYSKQDNNYANSVFMILALVKELENIGFSSEKAFQSIFKVFWEQDPKNSDWKTKFEETFTIDIDTFYASLTSYSTDMSLIYPSSTITVQNIINDTSTISLVSTESTATETTATETTATETTATETTSTETTATETTATETTATETTSTETTSTETTSTETTSTETTSTETTSNTYSITVTAQSSSNYILSGSDQNGNVSGNDPSISVKAGDTLSFNVNSPGHPFFIIVNSNGGFESNNLPSGITNNGSSTGAVSWTPTEAGTYYYICEYHPSMIGTITITQ
jgi:plastocyanin